MNYTKIYEQLISKRKIEIISEGYYEKHHIVPKCMGGSDDKNNLINLTAREHIFAHILLMFIYPDNNKIKYAAKCMTTCSCSKEHKEAINCFSTRFLAKLREEAGGSRKGSGNPMFGRTQKESTKKLISEINTGRKFTPEQSKAHSEKMKARVITDEWKSNISKGMIGKKHPISKPRLSDEQRKRKSEIARNNGKIGKKKVIDSKGTIYESISDCARKNGVSLFMMQKYIYNNPEKGFKLYKD